MDFVAFDVETANRFRGSVCQIGMSEVEDGRVVATRSWLTRPPGDLNYFEARNISIHGIRPEDVVDAPDFVEALAEMLKIADGRPFVAHNAAFDVGAIRKGCVEAGIAWPTMDYGCTLVMARRTLDLVAYGLPLCCYDLGIPLGDHHDAGADAQAAALVALGLADRHGAASLQALARACRVRLGHLNEYYWSGCATHGQSGAGPVPTDFNGDPEHPLFGKTIVITGGLWASRNDVHDLLRHVGAVPGEGITKKTDYLVIGDGFTGRDPADFHTGKAVKAVKYREKGVAIEVLTEMELWALLDDDGNEGTREDAAV